MIAPNLIIPYDGTNASIPSGFTRDTRFDGKFIKGANSDLGGTGGNNTHTHSSAAHTHQLNVHSHSCSYAWSTGSEIPAGTGTGYRGFHKHSDSTITTHSGGNLSDSFTTGSGSSLPPFYTMIFIKSNSYNLLPANSCIFSSGDLGLTAHASSGRFIVGAGTGENAGTTGGGGSHTHTINHTHTAVNHSHSGTSGGVNDGGVFDSFSQTSTAGTDENHSHPVNLANSANTGSAYSGSVSSTIEPLHKTLRINKISSAMPAIEGMIAISTESSNPIGWVECNGTNNTPDLVGYYIKNSTTSSTGGSNTHTHDAVSHNHTQPSHTHSGSTAIVIASRNAQNSGAGNGSADHTHAVTVSSSSLSWANSNYTITEVNNEPEYIKVKFVMATSSALGGGGAIINNFL